LPEYSAEREPDESLMRQFQAGDGEAFDALFDRYSARLINFAFRFLHSREEAEDAAQDVFLRLRGKKERYDPSRPFRPWLFSIASRLVSNRLRQKKRHPLLSIFNREDDEGESPVLIDPADPPDERPEQTAEKRHMAAAVQSALAKLPENQRMAVVLARYEEMSQENIARTMGVSIIAVKSLLFRARQNLQKDLKRFISGRTPQKIPQLFEDIGV